MLNGNTIAIPLPDIHLKNIGKEKGGVSGGELGRIIASAVKQKLSGAYTFDKAVKATGEALNEAGKAIKNLFQ
jgi:hypothetical protein